MFCRLPCLRAASPERQKRTQLNRLILVRQTVERCQSELDVQSLCVSQILCDFLKARCWLSVLITFFWDTVWGDCYKVTLKTSIAKTWSCKFLLKLFCFRGRHSTEKSNQRKKATWKYLEKSLGFAIHIHSVQFGQRTAKVIHCLEIAQSNAGIFWHSVPFGIAVIATFAQTTLHSNESIAIRLL